MGERIRNVQAVDFDETHFRSKLEAETASVFKKLGIPYRYEQRKIVLLGAFKSPFQKNKVRQITYTPDFEIGNLMIECKGFETPEWKIKKKYIFKYLMENEPQTVFCQVHDSKKQLLEVLDSYWKQLGLNIKTTPKPSRKAESQTQVFNSVKEAFSNLHLNGKSVGPVLKSLTGEKEWVYGFNWKLNKINQDEYKQGN